MEKHSDVEYAPDTFLDLLQRHFYTVFNSNAAKEALDWLKYVVALVAFAGNALIIEKVFCGLDGEKIEKKVRKRVEYKYRYIADDPQDEVR